MFKKLPTILAALALAFSLSAAVKLADPAPNDPFKAETWQLANGVTVVVAPNPIPGKVYVAELFRVGSVDDPPGKTGLAHYLEHLLFKGSASLGTTDYAAEKPLLEAIEALYTLRENTSDPAEREKIYREIDGLSQRAARYAVPNEYTRLVEFLGGSRINAFTSYYLTCYVAELPPRALPHFFAVELDRFSSPVFRGFHTELETVYEERNMYQDSPARRLAGFVNGAIYRDHPLGTPIIGTDEDLRNPSPAKVMEFYKAYYTPSNLTVVLAGDVTAAAALPILEDTLGKLPAREPEPHRYRQAAAPAADEETVHTTQLPSSAIFQWNFYDLSEEERTVADVAAMVLGDEQNGIIFNNFILTGLASEYDASFGEYADGNSEFSTRLVPTDGSADTAVAMLDRALELLQNGDFPDGLVEAAALKQELYLLGLADTPSDVAMSIVYALGSGAPLWNSVVERTADYAQVSKREVADFARRFLARPKYIVKLNNGEEPPPEKLEKPPITPLEYADGGSEAFRRITALPTTPPDEDLPDIDRDAPATAVRTRDGGIVPVRRVENPLNELFTATVVFGAGYDQDPLLPFAAKLFNNSGAGGKSADELNAELAVLGGKVRLWAGAANTYLTISGPGRFFDRIAQLAADRLADPTVPPELIAMEAKNLADVRAREKESSPGVTAAFVSKENHGELSSYLRRPTVAELAGLAPEATEACLKTLAQAPAMVCFYGNAVNFEAALNLPGLLDLTGTADGSLPRPAANECPREDRKRVYVLNDPTRRQNIIALYRRCGRFDPGSFALRSWFNNYYGAGMSSLLFRTLREAQGLCYNIYGSCVTPSSPEGSHVFVVYMTTQADKTREALEKLLATGFPDDPDGAAEALKSTRDALRYTRFKGEDLLELAEEYRKMGLPSDYRKRGVEQSEQLTWEMLEEFYNDRISGYDAILIVGTPPEDEFLETLGEVVPLGFPDLFRD